MVSLKLLEVIMDPSIQCASPLHLLLNGTVPQTSKQLNPRWPYLAVFRKQNAKYKAKQKANYDAHYRVRNLLLVPNDTEVWVTTGASSEPVCGTVRDMAGAPRSYNVEVPSGDNRGDMRVVPQPSHKPAPTTGPVTSEEPTGAGLDPDNPSPPPTTT